jgi:hypothetical protein
VRKLVLILIAFFAVVTFIRAFAVTDGTAFPSEKVESEKPVQSDETG